MRKLLLAFWRAALTMCRADERYPAAFKPIIGLGCVYFAREDWLADRPISLVAAVIMGLLVVEYLATLRTQLRQTRRT